MNKTTILHIFFNEFHRRPLRYGVTVLDADGDIAEQRDLTRKPRAARFDEVRECGCGANSVSHLIFCTRQRRIFSHPLERKATGQTVMRGDPSAFANVESPSVSATQDR